MGGLSGTPFVVIGMAEDNFTPHHLATPIPFLEDLTRSFDASFGDPAQEPDHPTHTRSEGDLRPVQADGEVDGDWEKDLCDRLKLMGFSDPRPIVVPLPGRRVYLTRHYDLDRTVAVKVFLPIPGQKKPWREAFKREARAAARVDHPLVLRLYSGGQLPGSAFLIYDYCEGGSLADRLRVGLPSLAYAMRLVLQVARGTQAIHDAGLLHLDLKPSNIFMTVSGTPRIGDFGLARIMDARGLAWVDQPAGTPGYMAPEQAIAGSDLGPTADVHGLGALLYHMLTGRPPRQGRPEASRSLADWVFLPVPLPSSLRRVLPGDVEELIMSALDTVPGRRPPTAEAFAESLEGCLSRSGWSFDRNSNVTTEHYSGEFNLGDGLRFAVFRKDLRGRYLYANDAFCVALGRSRHGLLGATDAELYPPDMASRYRASEERVIQTNEVHEDVEEHLSHACSRQCRCRLPGTGSSEEEDRQYIQSFLAPLRDPEGVVTGLQGLFFNITALKQAERRSRQVAEKLEQANTGLRRSNMELAQFAGMISHDLQAPLGTVHGLVDRVLVRELAELRASSRQALTHALDSLDRMLRMVSDLLRISRVRNAERAPEVVDSRLACAQALANLRVDLEARGGQVYLAPMPEVLARFTLVMQLFQNLFHNALKFSGDRVPLIRVGWRRDGQRMARFWVRDNGIGIPAGHEERIFEIYERGDRARDLPGSGVGLALCRRIVEQEGGRIWVESEPGVGSTFYFTLPLAQTVSPAAVPALENTP